ncbi:hypothetical protein TNCV_1084431 [Trichonephila clavipes]|nr:hypothetical protein TNCV_1084431 [Trichonephila clavipes]
MIRWRPKAMSDMFGEEVVTAKTCQRGLVKFCWNDSSLKEELRSGMPSDVSEEVLRSKIRTNPTLTYTEVSVKIRIFQNTALDYNKRLVFLSKLSVWMPHELSEKIEWRELSICVLHIFFVTKGNRFWTTWRLKMKSR